MSPSPSVLVLAIDRALDKRSLARFRYQNSRRGRPGVLIATIVNDATRALAIAYGPKTTRGEAFAAINAALPIGAAVKAFGLRGMLTDDVLVSTYDGHDGAVWEVRTFAPREETIQFFVKDLNGKTITITATPSDSIHDVKMAIQDKTGTIVDQQLLIHEGKHLAEQQILSDVIRKESTLHLTMRLLGGGGGDVLPFVDVEGKTTTIGFNANAPDWRLVAPGLNLSGRCENRLCPAWGQLIYVRQGFGTFHLHSLEGRDQMTGRVARDCPQCGDRALMTSMGFVQCYWEVWGAKMDSEGHVESFHKKPREVAPGDFLQAFTPSKHGEKKYGTLTVRTRAWKNGGEMCIVCKEHSYRTTADDCLPCGHGAVDANCKSKVLGGVLACPLCDRPPSYTLVDALAAEASTARNSRASSSTTFVNEDDLVFALEDWMKIKFENLAIV